MFGRATRSLLGGAAAAFDRAATKLVYVQSARKRRRHPAESLGHDERIEGLERLAAHYDDPVVAGYFREPRVIEPTFVDVGTGRAGGETTELRWPSAYEALLPGVRDRYHGKVENRLAAARLVRRPGEPRPVMILVHGYMTGGYAFEERAWPSAWLYRIGLDLAYFVLPFHGVRAIADRKGPPPFPASDPRVTNEGFRQTLGDLRDLIHWLLDCGHPSVGLMGMSLGGYITALACTLESELSFAVPVIPLTSLADFARDQGRLGSTPVEEEREHAALDRVHRVVSPLHRESVLPPHRMLVIAARADRITPIAHARRLAAHFGAHLECWHGGHLLQFGRAEKFRLVGRFLNQLGVIDRRRSAGR
ncbi:MAG: hypothetical protein JRI68_03205 [Deltaproteobacteria bacterium]|nr:hypothetical protein [Deltaproteobacteria bacterium]